MLTDAEKMELAADLENVDYSYPLGSEDYTPTPQIFRKGEFVLEKLPAISLDCEPADEIVVGAMNNVTEVKNGKLLFGEGQLNMMHIAVRVNQKCKGTNTYHGRLVADAYNRRIKKRIRRYWPKILWDMGAQIKWNMGFSRTNLNAWLPTNLQGYGTQFYIISRNEWNYLPDDTEEITVGPVFNDARIYSSGQDNEIDRYFSVTGDLKITEV